MRARKWLLRYETRLSYVNPAAFSLGQEYVKSAEPSIIQNRVRIRRAKVAHFRCHSIAGIASRYVRSLSPERLTLESCSIALNRSFYNPPQRETVFGRVFLIIELR